MSVLPSSAVVAPLGSYLPIPAPSEPAPPADAHKPRLTSVARRGLRLLASCYVEDDGDPSYVQLTPVQESEVARAVEWINSL